MKYRANRHELGFVNIEPFFPLQVSCRNHTAQKDLCCFEAPGGHLLSTQLWFYDPNVGEADSWTLHGEQFSVKFGLLLAKLPLLGLWPDNCDGSYSSSCQPSRNVYNVTEVSRLLCIYASLPTSMATSDLEILWRAPIVGIYEQGIYKASIIRALH